MKHAPILITAFLLLLAACTQQMPQDTMPDGSTDEVFCTMDAKICPDGFAVGRIGPDCEFAPCPGDIVTPLCDTSSDEYVGKTPDQCATIRFTCDEGKEYFADECGCGCKVKEDPKETDGKLKATDCLPEQRGDVACTREYRPVCGWNDPAKIQCIRYPCAQTYGNNCEACADENVISWTDGECPP